MRRILLLLMVCVVVLSMIFIGIGCKEEVVPAEEEKEPIKIGACLTLSSIIPLIQEEQQRGFGIAVEGIGGSVNGHPIELIYADIDSMETAKSEATRLIQVEGVKILIGSGVDPFDSAMSAICERNDVIFWMTLTGGPILTQPGQNLTFRTNPWSTLEGTLQADWFLQEIFPLLGLDDLSEVKAAMLHLDSEWGIQMSTEVVSKIEAAGVEVVYNESYSEETTTNMDPVVLKIIDEGANVFFAPGMFPGGGKLFWDAAKLLDFNPLVAIGTGGFLGTDYAKEVLGDYINGFCSTNWPIQNTNPELSPGMEKFLSLYMDKYGEGIRTTHSVSGYTGMLFLLDALQRTTDINDINSLVEAIRATDIPERDIGIGWGAQFAGPDEWNNGTNLRAFDVGVQWQDGEMWSLYPVGFAGRELELPMKTWTEKAEMYE